ncbi:MAG TPA: hypothetical protein VJ973_00405, partial [Christiangramia sp.]|nr:hypothetical protein [Christiangramia sp.]
MIKISSRSLDDLEFPVVCEQISELCITGQGKEKALTIQPYPNYKKTVFGLDQTNEYFNSKTQDQPIPNHGFDSIQSEIKLLGIEGSVVEITGFRKISSITEIVNTHLKYFRKYSEVYPALSETVSHIEYDKSLTDRIDGIIDRFGEMKDDASPLLQDLRRSINSIRGKINSSFNSALTNYQSYGYLDEIKESVVENVRVLAVKAMYR